MKKASISNIQSSRIPQFIFIKNCIEKNIDLGPPDLQYGEKHRMGLTMMKGMGLKMMKGVGLKMTKGMGLSLGT